MANEQENPPEQPQAPAKTRPLSDRQERFAEEYVLDLNATAAYKRSGFADNQNSRIGAAKLLRHPGVRRRIDQLLEERAARTAVSSDRVVRELAKIAFASLRDYVGWGPDGVRIRDSDLLSSDDAAAVIEVREHAGKASRTVTFRLAPKTDALELLARHLGMLTDRTRVEGPEGAPLEFTLNIFDTPARFPRDGEQETEEELEAARTVRLLNPGER